MKGDATSAAFPFQVQLEQRISADPQLSALLGAGADARIFASAAPAGTLYPYLTIGLTQETARSTFDKWGNDGQTRVDIWTERAKFANSQGLAIYSHLKRVFQGKQFPLTTQEGTEHDLVTCSVELVVDVPDPDGKSQHTQVLFTPRSQQRAV
jgi:hypothetical protein